MRTNSPLHAVVMASGINRIPLYADYQPGYKALLPFDGEPAIQYTLDALNALPEIESIHIVGDEEALREAVARSAAREKCTFTPGGETLLESLLHGLESCRDVETALFVTADVPLLTPAAVQEFMAACSHASSPYKENFYLAVVPKHCFTGEYARTNKGFSRFRDLRVCHGNIALANPAILRNELALTRINAIYNARKSPIGSALAFGWRVGLSYVLGVHLFHLLTMAQMAGIASHRFGFGVIPVVLERPEVCIDVDEPEDYALVQELLASQKRGTVGAGQAQPFPRLSQASRRT